MRARLFLRRTFRLSGIVVRFVLENLSKLFNIRHYLKPLTPGEVAAIADGEGGIRTDNRRLFLQEYDKFVMS